MTGRLPDLSPGCRVARRVAGRPRIVAALIAVVVLSAGVLLVLGRLPGAPMRDGPLEGTRFEELRATLRSGDTGLLWGSLVLHNPTAKDVVLDEVGLAGNPQGLKPSAGPYLWDMTRVELLDTGAVSGYALPLPSSWRLPRPIPVSGYVLPPGGEDDSVEVLYEFPVPQRTSVLTGMTVGYHTGGIAYRKTYDVTLTVCPPDDHRSCRRS